ncbi:insulinase family protein, partial [Candidatus Fermentibacterales bacterium]|nr:insulinase family protein [Candidatus Fermentibacterales bacterium]
DPDEVRSERKVVEEEWMLTSVDSPSGALEEALYATAFTVHPYRFPIPGTRDDIRKFDPHELASFYRAHYRPGNAFLAIVGDIDAGRAEEEAQRFFGGIPDEGVEQPEPPAEPPQTSSRLVEIEHDSSLSRFALAFRAPSGDHPDSCLLEMAAAWLAGGRSSRLEEALVRAGLAVDVSASCDCGIDPGLFVIRAVLDPGIEPESAREIINREISSLAAGRVGREEFERQRNRLASMLQLADSSPIGRAMDLVSGECLFGDCRHSERTVERLSSLDSGDLVEAAARYLGEGNSTLALLRPASARPGGGTGSAALPEGISGDVSPPSAIDYEGLDIPDSMLEPPSASVSAGAVEMSLPNGSRLVYRRDSSFPIVALAISVPMATHREPPGLPGLAAVTAETMLHGAGGFDHSALHSAFEDNGTAIDLAAREEYAGTSYSVPSRAFERTLEALFAMLGSPSFAEEHLEIVRAAEKAELAHRRDSTFGQAFEKLEEMMAMPGRPDRIPSMESLDKIGRSDLVEFHRACCRPSGSIVVVVGDAGDPELLAGMMERASRGWSDPPDQALPPLLGPGIASHEGLARKDTLMRGRLQVAIALSCQAPSRDAPPMERTAFSALNMVLGGGLGSRLGHVLREEQGLAYSVGSDYAPRREAGRFVAYLSTGAGNAGLALDSLMGECEKVCRQGVEPAELLLVKSSAVGRHALSNMEYESLAARLMRRLVEGLPLEEDLAILERTLALTPEDLLAVAKARMGVGGWFVSLAGGLATGPS